MRKGSYADEAERRADCSTQTGSETAFGKAGGRAGDAAGMTRESGAELLDSNGRAGAIVGRAGTAMIAGETQGLELAVNGAGPKAHDGIPCKVYLPLCDLNIAVQHRFDKQSDCGPAMHQAHGRFHNSFTLPEI